jgi:hypothetical protein
VLVCLNSRYCRETENPSDQLKKLDQGIRIQYFGWR